MQETRTCTPLRGKSCPIVLLTSGIAMLIKSTLCLHCYDCVIIVHCRAKSRTMVVFFFLYNYFEENSFSFVYFLEPIASSSRGSLKCLSWVFSTQ